ncbi:MAG: Hsp33 family molecular chaperone HslO [Anaerolineae bacterium]
MSDLLVRVLAKGAGVRGLACVTTETVHEAVRRHAAYPVAAAALGYGLTAGVLLGGLLKVQERVALKIEGDGPLRKMVVESDAYGHVRGYVAVPDAPSPAILDRAAVSAALGRRGVLTVVKDLRVRDLYRSVVALEGVELGREIENYLNKSEQIPSLVEIGVAMDENRDVLAAGGVLVQPVRGSRGAGGAPLAARRAGPPPLETQLAQGASPDTILAQLFADTPHEVLEQRLVSFRCTCSWERSRQALKMLAREDLLALVADGEATVDCHFCYARYRFTRDDLEAVLREVSGS